MADDTKRCKHPGCLCPADEDSDYCSAYCQGAGERPETICDCGCPDCM